MGKQKVIYKKTRYFRQKRDNFSKTNVQLRLKGMFLELPCIFVVNLMTKAQV